jgi:hypothetical protein
MAFYHLPNPWNPGYAIPEYVMAEPPGRGTFTTKMLPRRTISQLPPDFLAKPVKKHTLSKPEHGRQGTLSGSSLGDAEVFDLEPFSGTGGKNPFESYGKELSSWIVKSLKTLPAKERGPALKEYLSKVDPGLPGRVKSRTARYKAQGMSPDGALQHALSDELEVGLGKEIVKLGKEKGKKPSAVSGYLGCGSSMGNYFTLSGVGDWVSSALDKTGDVACKVVTNPLAPAVAGGIAATQGVPPQLGAAGVAIGAGMCASGQSAPAPTVQQPGMPGWVLPAAIGGGALILILALK